MGENTSYLFGTIHMDISPPEIVKKALLTSDKFIMETDLFSLSNNEIQKIRWQSKFMATQNKNFQSLQYIESVKRNLRPLLQQFEAEDFLEHLIINLTPLQISLVLLANERPALKSSSKEKILDLQLMEYAKKQNKIIDYLEPLQNQLELLHGWKFSFDEHIEFYDYVESHLFSNKLKTYSADGIKNFYFNQNITALRECLIRSDLTETKNCPKIIKKYFNDLGHNREIEMVNNIKLKMQNSNAFICVGAGHLKAIVDGLSLAGYSVNSLPINASFLNIKRHKFWLCRMKRLLIRYVPFGHFALKSSWAKN
ncbi:TraB/GumN family protein [Legionella feeleii]|nr:TraB/GumN family protein [Legionella feeleii]